MSEPKVSEGMKKLVSELLDAQRQAERLNMVTDYLVSTHTRLCTAIAALEARADTAEACAILSARPLLNRYETDPTILRVMKDYRENRPQSGLAIALKAILTNEQLPTPALDAWEKGG